MCYLLTVASPLTLSEVRSMLPAGMHADLQDAGLVRAWRPILPETQTVVALIHGGCSCDFVRPRPADVKADDAELRKRYRLAGASRAVTIHALERHARARALRKYAPGHWPVALSRFVTEHARNAGETGYLLDYETGAEAQERSDAERPLRPSATAPLRPSVPAPLRLRVPARNDHAWLAPDTVIIVTP